MSSHCEPIKILHFPDLHLGRPCIPPQQVYDHITKHVYPRLPEIKILNIGGDFFDYLINLNNDAGIYAAIIADDLVNFAKTYKFYIRVVRGTFSHDRYQNRLFLTKNRGTDQLNGKPLVRVIDGLELEVFEDLKISVLYCPDNQPYQDVTQAILDILDAHKLKTVDFIFSHGYFEHLLPRGLTQLPHNTLIYNRLEKRIAGGILNGHVHTPNVYKKVINGGSFERLQHGEEEDKGYFIVIYDRNKHKLTYEFVSNPDAFPFITVDISATFNVEDALALISKKVDEVRKRYNNPNQRVFLRLAGNSEFVALYVRDNYDNVVVSTKKTGTQEVNTEELVQQIDELPIITEDNLSQLIEQGLKGTDCPLTEDEIKEILNGTD